MLDLDLLYSLTFEKDSVVGKIVSSEAKKCSNCVEELFVICSKDYPKKVVVFHFRIEQEKNIYLITQ